MPYPISVPLTAPVTIVLELRRLNGQTLRCELPFADEMSALVLKSRPARCPRCCERMAQAPSPLNLARALCGYL
jgi:hypothetical protein